jgi:YVTN family beta-propeller protein
MRSRAFLARGFAALLGALVPVLAFGARPAAAAPFAYVTNWIDNSVWVIDIATNNVVGSPIPVGRLPEGVAVTPDGTKVYVANNNLNLNGTGTDTDTVSVITTATNTVVATITVGNQPSGVAVTPDGTKVYVVNQGGTVSVIATASNTVVATVTVGANPSGVAVTPDGTKVYVVNTGYGGSSTVSVIATASNTVVGSPIPVGFFPRGIAITPDGTKVYVTNQSDGTVSVIVTATNNVVGSQITVEKLPLGVAVTPDGTKVYVANRGSGTVSAIATATNAVVATIPVGGNPYGIAVTPDGTNVYVTTGNTVSVIDTATNNVVGSPIPVGNSAQVVGIIGPLPLVVPPPPVAACDATKEQTCESLVQDQILWNLADTGNAASKHWARKDLERLCGCTVYPPDTVNCFQTLLYNEGLAHRTQAQAIALCRAKKPGDPSMPDMSELAGERACDGYLLNRNVPTLSASGRVMAPILDGTRLELCRGAADDAAAAMRIWCLGASFTQKVSPFQAAYNCSHGQGPEFRGGPRPAWPPPQPAAWEKP